MGYLSKILYSSVVALGLASSAFSGERISQQPLGTRTTSRLETLTETKDFEEYFRYIGSNEGMRSFVYDDLTGKRLHPGEKAQGKKTIGIGHNLERGDSKKLFEKLFPGINYDRIADGREGLNNEEIKKLFYEDIRIYLERARKLFPQFDTYPIYLRTALLDGVYRGDLSGSPKTIKLINEGKFEEASKEYLNHREYKNARRMGREGIRLRMDKNSKAMKRYAEELKGKSR